METQLDIPLRIPLRPRKLINELALGILDHTNMWGGNPINVGIDVGTEELIEFVHRCGMIRRNDTLQQFKEY